MKRVTLAVVLMLTGAVAASALQSAGELPDLENTGVVVPWEDFKQILEDLRRPQPTPVVPPPVDFAMSECRGSAIVGNDERGLRVTLAFTVQVLNDRGWVEIPLLAENVALVSAKLDGRPAQLYRKNSRHTVALRGAGTYRIELEYLLDVQESRGTHTARLEFPQAPVVVVDLSVPRGGVDIQIDGAVMQSIARSSSTTRVTAALRQTRDTSVSWFARVEAADRESKVFAEIGTLVAIGEGVMRGTTNASVSIHGNGIDSFDVEIPNTIAVLGVNVQGLRGWEVVPITGVDGRSALSIDLNYLAEGSFGFSFDFEQQFGGATEFVLPDIAMENVVRERGFIAVAADTNVEITAGGGLENATPVDPSELPPYLVAGDGGSVLYGFKYLRHPVVVPLEVIKHLDVAVKRTVVETARLRTFVSRDGKILTSARYSIRNNRKQNLSMDLPEGSELWGAYLEGEPVKAARRADGVTLVPLRMTATDAAGQLRAFSLEVVYFQDEKRLAWLGRRTFQAPVLDVDVLEMRWVFFLPRNHWYLGFKGNLAEDETANRIALVGAAAYNLANVDDVSLLGMVSRDGKAYLSDGVNEAELPDVEVRSAGQKRDLTADEISKLVGERQLGDEGDVGAADKQSQAISRMEQSYRAPSPSLQVDPADRDALNRRRATGSRVRGMLPVRIEVPSDGLRLSFTGRLVTADEPPVVAMGYVPADWRLPRLGRWWSAALAFAATLLLLFLIPFDSGERSFVRLAGAFLGVVVLVAVFAAAGGHRLAFAVGCAAAVGLFGLLRTFVERPVTGEGF